MWRLKNKGPHIFLAKTCSENSGSWKKSNFFQLCIWLLALAINSPFIFGFAPFGLEFGQFGWDRGGGRCDVTSPDFTYVFGSVIPFLVIFVR